MKVSMNLRSLTTKMLATRGRAPLSPLFAKAFRLELHQFLHGQPRMEPILAPVNVQRTRRFGAS